MGELEDPSDWGAIFSSRSGQELFDLARAAYPNDSTLLKQLQLPLKLFHLSPKFNDMLGQEKYNFLDKKANELNISIRGNRAEKRDKYTKDWEPEFVTLFQREVDIRDTSPCSN